MADLRNTIAHILEHEQHLVDANEATIQQYVILPILRALEWDDANLASMEIQPEYKVESKRADYALHLQRDQNPVVLIECKRWNQPIGKSEEQICFYAYSGNVPLAIITNGKLWRFYLSRWEASSLSDRIFCETDIESRENAIADLEKYLLKSNVVSGEAELNAEIALEEKAEASNSRSTDSEVDDVNVNNTNNQSVTKQATVASEVGGEWTVERVKDSLPQELRIFHEKTYSKEKLELFYGAVAGVQNLIKKEKWKLNPPKFSKMLCGFWLTDKGVIGKIERIFGILPSGKFPDPIMDKDGQPIKKVQSLPRIFARITKAEAKQLERAHNGCEYYGVMEAKSADYVYYDVPQDMSTLFPVLKFVYNKHRGQ